MGAQDLWRAPTLSSDMSRVQSSQRHLRQHVGYQPGHLWLKYLERGVQEVCFCGLSEGCGQVQVRKVSSCRIGGLVNHLTYCLDRCKKPVVAEKQFTIHDAPAVLTVHLKRFSPLGRKIGHFVHYDERLSLQPVMSEGQYGPLYHLYGIISHAGGGPNSGHYFAHVKAANGRWYEMNDEMVSPQHKPPVDMKSAYILFYMKDKGQSLDAVVRSTEAIPSTTPSAKSSIVGSMKKRRVVGDDEDVGVKVDRPFIGPLLPSPIANSDACPSSSSNPAPDPQAVSLQKKIAAATKSSDALSSLALYGDDDSTDSPTEPRPTDSDTPTDSPTATLPPTSSLPSEATSDASTASTATNTPPFDGITPSSFYATPTSMPAYNSHNSQLNDKKRKPSDSDTDDDGDDEGPPPSGTSRHSQSPPSTFTSKQGHGHHHNRSHSPHHPFRRKSFGGGAVNPYNRAVGNNTLFHKKKYTMKRRMIM